MNVLIFNILFSFLTFHLVTTSDVCGNGWDRFQDEYYDICYKYYPDGLGDYETVATACRGDQNSSLPTINSRAEQDFLNKLIVKYKMVDSVWLDATIKDRHIVWADSSSAEYENWIPGRPVNDSNCVEMVPDDSNLGKWLDRPCNKKNAYMCKRVVIWSSQRTERLIRDNRRLLDESMARITQLESCQIPDGFIYIQLPYQAAPRTLWPKCGWSDVTSTYAGEFFRAEGGGSRGFEAGVQSADSPHLTNIHRYANSGTRSRDDIDIVPGYRSYNIETGNDEGPFSTDYYLDFLVSNVEVRPRNQAVRIFKRD